MNSKRRSRRFHEQIGHPADSAPVAPGPSLSLARQTPPLAVSLYLISRNLVPVIGVLFLGWSAAHQLLLYFIDTLLGLGVVCALIFQVLFPIESENSVAGRINAAGGIFGGSGFIVAVMAIPLGVPLIFVLGPGGFPLFELLQRQFLVAVAAHVALALLTFVAMFREMPAVKDPGPALKRQFGWILMRWVVVVVIIYTGVPMLLGHFGGLLVVIAYAAFGIAGDLAPRAVASLLRLDAAVK